VGLFWVGVCFGVLLVGGGDCGVVFGGWGGGGGGFLGVFGFLLCWFFFGWVVGFVGGGGFGLGGGGGVGCLGVGGGGGGCGLLGGVGLGGGAMPEATIPFNGD